MVRCRYRVPVGRMAGGGTVKHAPRLWRHLMTPQDTETDLAGVVRRTLMGDTAYVCLMCQWRTLGVHAYATELEARLHAIARHEC